MDKRVKQLLSLACVGVFTLVIAGSSRANLLTDPGFENGTTTTDPNHTGVPGWAPANIGASYDGVLTTGVALGGTNVWETGGGAGGFNVPLAYQVFGVTAGQTYVLSGNLYLPAALASGGNDFALLQLGFFTGAPPNNYVGGTEISSASSANYGSPGGVDAGNLPVGQWVSLSVTGTAVNVGLNHVNSMGAYMIDVNGDSSATFYWDNLDLELIPEPSTVALVLTSFAGGFLFLRRRRSK